MLTVLDNTGAPVSSVLSFYFRDEVLPYYAGDHERARALAANDFKYWDLMRRAVERGVRVFDYGRSKRGTGSFDFKKNWGFEADAAQLRILPEGGEGIPAEQSAEPEVPGLHRDVAAPPARDRERPRPFDRAESRLRPQ